MFGETFPNTENAGYKWRHMDHIGQSNARENTSLAGSS